MSASTNPSPPFRLNGLDHVVLRVSDMEAAKNFYCDVLGCVVERIVDSLGLVQLRAGASLIDLVDIQSSLGKAGGAPPGNSGRNMDHFCVRIDPFNESDIKSLLKSNGIATDDIGRRYGADGYGPSLYITDPDGNTVELKGPPDDADK